MHMNWRVRAAILLTLFRPFFRVALMKLMVFFPHDLAKVVSATHCKKGKTVEEGNKVWNRHCSDLGKPHTRKHTGCRAIPKSKMESLWSPPWKRPSRRAFRNGINSTSADPLMSETFMKASDTKIKRPSKSDMMSLSLLTVRFRANMKWGNMCWKWIGFAVLSRTQLIYSESIMQLTLMSPFLVCPRSFRALT